MAFQDFDLISERRRLERKQKLRKRIMIGVVVSIVLVAAIAAILCVTVLKTNQHAQKNSSSQKGKKGGGAAHDQPPSNIAQSQKAIKAVCASTDYKEACEAGLTKAVKAHPASQPKDLVNAAISIASDALDKAANQTAKLLKPDDPPEKKSKFEVCTQVFDEARQDFANSLSATLGGKQDLRAPDLNAWLSAALSYQETCVDAFLDGDLKSAVKGALKEVKELTSNSLAIVSQFTSFVSTFKGSFTHRRRLLEEDGLPVWMNPDQRRLLKATKPDAPKLTPNATVAKDGSGNFSTISAALAALPQKYQGRYIIYLKEGIYNENVIVTKNMVNITMYGDGSQKTIITGNKNYVDGVPTFLTATFAAIGEGFMAQSIGFRNTAGPEKHQAVALRVQSDRSIFLNCRMEGYQDTLYAQAHRQFYRGCLITGTVDFIFGDASAIFQACDIIVRKPMDNQQNIVTAQGRVDKHQTTGIVLQKCTISADPKLEPEKQKIKSYLGRPWKEYSRTIVMESEIGDLIQPEGWLPWSGEFALKTLYYAEHNNIGPGADTKARVKWPGYKGNINKEEAMKYTVAPFIQGDTWLKASAVPVRVGLYS